MTRLRRIVAPGLPHLVTARSHHGQAKHAQVEMWAQAITTRLHLIREDR